MLIQIKTTKKHFYDENGNELVGDCAFPKPQQMVIRVSTRFNNTVNKFGGTLLHEMLHAWVNMLERKGFHTDEEREEDFILKAEQIIIREFSKKFGRKTNGSNSRSRIK